MNFSATKMVGFLMICSSLAGGIAIALPLVWALTTPVLPASPSGPSMSVSGKIVVVGLGLISVVNLILGTKTLVSGTKNTMWWALSLSLVAVVGTVVVAGPHR